MTWTVIPNARLRANEPQSLWRRLWTRVRYWRAAPVARVALWEQSSRTIVTHPDNVVAVCDYLAAQGWAYKVAAPSLQSVAGGRK